MGAEGGGLVRGAVAHYHLRPGLGQLEAHRLGRPPGPQHQHPLPGRVDALVVQGAEKARPSVL